MSKKVVANSRISPRFDALKDRFQGSIYEKDSDVPHSMQILDVSEGGIRILTDFQFGGNQDVVIKIEKPFKHSFTCYLIWCRKSQAKKGYEAGLQVFEGQDVLLDIFDFLRKENEILEKIKNAS